MTRSTELITCEDPDEGPEVATKERENLHLGIYSKICICGVFDLLRNSFVMSKLRSWIEEQHEKIVESEKEAKGKVNATNDKEKLLKRKLQDKVAKLIIAKNGALLSISEHEALVSQINSEAAQAHAELLEAEGIVPKKKHRCDVLRTEPYRVDVDGRIFWKLKGYNNGEDIVLQDLGAWDAVVSKEEWFVYGAETKEAIDNYCSSLRRKKSSGTVSQTVPRESDEENM
ncbi:uncharacterized protein LOC133744202 [Rosa rugosa]|uniref:uncharacterized protein LOC133744202 n=1 Tax=Rosa rugosa TaxID=74645 RepID=UPI002B417B94|nr:uncharacterized protein LOC133744202 [Rosa rugosa]